MSDWPIIMPGTLEHGKLKLNRAKLAELLKARRDCDVTVLIERKHATRSLSQNAWYWAGIMGTISAHTGYTQDEVHELMKAMFLPKKLEILGKDGELVEFTIGTTTTSLNKIEFGEYIEQIRQWAAETLELYIPDPEGVPF